MLRLVWMLKLVYSFRILAMEVYAGSYSPTSELQTAV